jgi:GINS complex subunit 1
MSGAGGGSNSLSGFPFGNRARELLLELRRSDWLSPYNDEGVRQVISEINALHQQVSDRLPTDGTSVDDPSLASPLVVFHTSILRNKRCLLAYLRFRVDKLRDLRWEHGPVLVSAVCGLGCSVYASLIY